jgi:hypothetical protein
MIGSVDIAAEGVAKRFVFRLQSHEQEMSDSPRSNRTSRASQAVREWSSAALVSFLVSLAVVTPFFFRGTASGHDIAFHMASWLDAASQWKQGVVLPRWAEWANFGFGEPRFIFYPPLSWLFGAFLGSIIPWQTVAVVFIACTQSLAGLSAYAALRRVVNRKVPALIGAGCFAANPYALLIIYMRSDFAELLALAFFPWLLFGALRLSGMIPQEAGSKFRQMLLFAFPFCAIWLSNAPAAVIASYSAALLFVVAAVRTGSFLPIAKGAAGMSLGFGFASFYMIPAIYEQRWVNIAGALAGGLKPEQNFLFAKTSDAEHDAFNVIASRVAVLMIFWALLGAIAAWRSNLQSKENSVRNGGKLIAITTLGAAAAALMLPITEVFWRYLPELRFVQFPWRWMSVLAVCTAAFTAISARGWLRWTWLLFATLAIAISANFLVKTAWWDSEDMPTLQTDIKNGAGFEGTDEYDPFGDDHTDLKMKEPRAELIMAASEAGELQESKIEVRKWTAEHRVVRVSTPKPALLKLHLLNYPAWRVTVNGEGVSVQHPKGTEQMIVAVPAGESELRIYFRRTFDRTLGGWISVTSFLGSIGFLFWKRQGPLVAKA